MLSMYSHVTLTVDVGVEDVPEMHRPGAIAIARHTRRPITSTSKPLKRPDPLNSKASSDSLPQRRRVTTFAQQQKIRSEYLTNHANDASSNNVRHMKNERAHRPPPATIPHIENNSFIQTSQHAKDNTKHPHIDLVAAFAEFEDLERVRDGDTNLKLELGQHIKKMRNEKERTEQREQERTNKMKELMADMTGENLELVDEYFVARKRRRDGNQG